MSQVAQYAGVGKGTPYRYWASKEDLLADLFAQDLIDVIAALEMAIRQDSSLIAPSRLLPLVEFTLSQHPFAAAVHAHDRELLGAIAMHPVIPPLIRIIGPVGMFLSIFPVLRKHHIMRTDSLPQMQVHTAAALLHGNHDIGHREPIADLLPNLRPLDSLQEAARILFDAATPPPIAFRAAAEEVLARLEESLTCASGQLTTYGMGKYSV